jgi:hypothetical protein
MKTTAFMILLASPLIAKGLSGFTPHWQRVRSTGIWIRTNSGAS